MRDLLAAETARTTVGKAWLALLAGGLILGGITVVSLAAGAGPAVAAGSTTAARATDDTVRYWMTMHLFSALFGAIFVTREYTCGVIVRSVLLSGGRGRLLTAKVVGATAMGVVFAAASAAAGAIAPWVVLPLYGVQPSWTAKTWQVLAGVAAVVVLSAPWGALIGWIVRNQVVAVCLLAVFTMGVEPYLHKLLPDVGDYLLTIAMGSVYLDPDASRLAVLPALAVILAWLVLFAGVAVPLIRRRDVP
jgi:hypothetical protein